MSNNNPVKNISNKAIPETIHINEGLLQPSISLSQDSFCLSEVDFIYIKNNKSATLYIAVSFFSAFMTGGVELLIKYLDDSKNVPSEWTIKIILFGIIVSGIVWFVGFLCPSKHKKTMKKIEEHFKNAEIRREIRND